MKIVIFSTCKPFKNDDLWRQEQAIGSWYNLRQNKYNIKIVIVLIGNDFGTNDICKKYNLIHEPDVKNMNGIPYVLSMFQIAEKYANEDDYIIWVNSDIIFFSDLIENINIFDNLNEQCKKKNFLKRKPVVINFALVGQRYDWRNPKILDSLQKEDFVKNINIDDNDTLEYIEDDNKINLCRLHEPCGIDYIIFNKNSYTKLNISNEFIIGGPGFDLMLLFYAFKYNFITINLTNTNLVIHQNHGYSNRPNEKLIENAAEHNSKFLRDDIGKNNILSCKLKTYLNGSNIYIIKKYIYI